MDALRVLLVDDEEDLVRSLAQRLEIRDYVTDVALDGEEALRKIALDPPSVMVLDLRMPRLDGLEVLRRLATSRPEIQVIMLTGHGSEREAEEARRLGVVAYLTKPVMMDELLHALDRARSRLRTTTNGVPRSATRSRGRSSGNADMETGSGEAASRDRRGGERSC